MLETGKISALQMGMIIYPVLVSTAMLGGPNVMAQAARNDLWLTPFWSSLIGFLSVFIAIQLHKRFPGMTIIEQGKAIAGTVPSAIMGLLYLLVLLQVSGVIVREYADFIAIFLKETPLGWYSEVFLISYLLPVLANRPQGTKAAVWTVAGAMITMTIVNLVTLFLMGDALPNILFPIMDTARYVSIADFFENMESAVMAIWVIGAFIKVSMFYYATVLGTAQCLNLTCYQPLIWPIGFLIVLFSFWGIPSFAELGAITLIAIPAILAWSFCFWPGCLLLYAIVRGKRSKAKEVPSG